MNGCEKLCKSPQECETIARKIIKDLHLRCSMAKMVITSNICIFFILKLVSKIVLDYLFFIDKSKSNRRRYRKCHNFLYKFFTGYVYSKKHMNESRCRNYIRVIYAIYVFLMTSDLVLLILAMDSFGVNSTSIYKYCEFGLMAVSLACLLWFEIHSKGKGFHWWFPPSWWRGRFYWDV